MSKHGLRFYDDIVLRFYDNTKYDELLNFCGSKNVWHEENKSTGRFRVRIGGFRVRCLYYGKTVAYCNPQDGDYLIKLVSYGILIEKNKVYKGENILHLWVVNEDFLRREIGLFFDALNILQQEQINKKEAAC